MLPETVHEIMTSLLCCCDEGIFPLGSRNIEGIHYKQTQTDYSYHILVPSGDIYSSNKNLVLQQNDAFHPNGAVGPAVSAARVPSARSDRARRRSQRVREHSQKPICGIFERTPPLFSHQRLGVPPSSLRGISTDTEQWTISQEVILLIHIFD